MSENIQKMDNNNDNNEGSSSYDDDDDDYDSEDDSYDSDIDNNAADTNNVDNVTKLSKTSSGITTMNMTSTTPSKTTATQIQQILLLSSMNKKKRSVEDNNNNDELIEDSNKTKKQKNDDQSDMACKDNNDCTTAVPTISQEEQEQIRCVVTAITMTMIPLSMIRKEEQIKNKNTKTSTPTVVDNNDNNVDTTIMIPVVFTGHADGTITRWDMMNDNKKHDDHQLNKNKNDNNSTSHNIDISSSSSSSSSSFQKKWTIIGCTDLITKHGTSQSIHKNIGIAGLVIRCRNQKNDDTKIKTTISNNTILLYSWSYQPDDIRYNINGIPQRIMIWNICTGKRISSIMIDIGKDSYNGRYANPLVTSIVFATIKNTTTNKVVDKNDMQEQKQEEKQDEWIDTVIVAVQAICDDNDNNNNSNNSTIGNILCFDEMKRTLYNNKPWNGHYYYPNCIITSLSVLPYRCIISIAEMPYNQLQQTLDNDPNITSSTTAMITTKDDNDHDNHSSMEQHPSIYIIADMIIWDIYNPGVILHRFDFYNSIKLNTTTISGDVIEQQKQQPESTMTVATTTLPKMIHVYDKRNNSTLHLQPKTKINNSICGIHSFNIIPCTIEESNITTTTTITEPLTRMMNDDNGIDNNNKINIDNKKRCSIILMSNHGQLVTVFQVQLPSHRHSSNSLVSNQSQKQRDETTTITSNENQIHCDNKGDNDNNDELVSSNDNNNPKTSNVHENNEKNDDVKGKNDNNNQRPDCYVDIIGYVQLDHVKNHDFQQNNNNKNNNNNNNQSDHHNNDRNEKDDEKSKDAIVIRSCKNDTDGRGMISSKGHMVGYNDQIVLSYSSLSSVDNDPDRKTITHDDIVYDDHQTKTNLNTNHDMIYTLSGNALYHYLLLHLTKRQPQQHRNLSEDALLLPPQQVESSSCTNMIGTSYHNVTTVSIHELVVSKGQQQQDELLQDKDISCSKPMSISPDNTNQPNVTKFVQKVMIPSLILHHIHPIFETPIVSSQLLPSFHITSLSINHDYYTVIGDSFGIFHYWCPSIQAMLPPIEQQEQQDSSEERSSSSLPVKGANEYNCYWNATRPTSDNDLYHPIPHLSSSSSKNTPELQNKCTIQ